MTDAAYAAIEKVGGYNVDIVIAESGWPSGQNGDIATIPNTRTYVNNLISHNTKDGRPTERHFGLYYPDMREIFPVTFR
ncbi:hypothetical protein MKX03_012958 [Papaver bracteatum]|nr:hypothetical protein MKX03_012958 [Papaver bracteatum]